MESFSVFQWIVVAVICYALYSIFWKPSKSEERVCKSCGYVGEGKVVTRGSLGIEIVLWLCFIVPGLVYSIWRTSSRFIGCPSCYSKEMIPADSPTGKKIIDAK